MISAHILLSLITTLLPNLVVAKAIDGRDAVTNQDCPAPGGQVIHHFTLQPDGSNRIVPGTRPVCLAVGKPVVGAPIGLIDCALTDAFNANWCIEAGVNPTVRLANTTLCLDATSNPANNTGVIVAECNPGRKSQSWTWSSVGTNNTLSLTFGNQCIDRKNGTSFFLDTTQCTTQEINNDQQWWISPSFWFIGS